MDYECQEQYDLLLHEENVKDECTTTLMPYDFNTYVRHMLDKFIMLTTINMTISYEEFTKFNELVDDMKITLKDHEYIDIMNVLYKLYKNVSVMCKCSISSMSCCDSSICDFQYCNNYKKFKKIMPQIEFVRFSCINPEYSSEQYNNFLEEYCVSNPLRFHIGVNSKINTIELIWSEYYYVGINFIKLVSDKIVGNSISKILILLTFYKYNLENIPVYVDDVWSAKLIDHIDVCFIKCKEFTVSVRQIKEQLMEILGISDCPFKIIMRTMIENRHLPLFEKIPASMPDDL